MTARPGDPMQIAILRARTEDAIIDLATIGSRDPGADRALRAVRLTTHTLLAFWVPALDALLARQRETEP